MCTKNCAFEASKGEMRFIRTFQRSGQGHVAGVASGRSALDRWSTGKAEAQYLCCLVKCLSNGIINSGCQPVIIANAVDPKQLAMAARHEQQQIGKLQTGINQPRRQGVALKMVDCDQWFAGCHGECLCRDQADHHAADQTRASGRSNCIDVVKGQASVRQSGRDQRRHQFGMRAGGNFGDYATKGTMVVLLSSQSVAENRPVGTHDCCCGFVAAGFKTKDDCHSAFP